MTSSGAMSRAARISAIPFGAPAVISALRCSALMSGLDHTRLRKLFFVSCQSQWLIFLISPGGLAEPRRQGGKTDQRLLSRFFLPECGERFGLEISVQGAIFRELTDEQGGFHLNNDHPPISKCSASAIKPLIGKLTSSKKKTVSRSSCDQ